MGLIKTEQMLRVVNLASQPEERKVILRDIENDIDKLWMNKFSVRERVEITELNQLIYAHKQDKSKACLRFLDGEEVLQFIKKNDRLRDGLLSQLIFKRSVLEQITQYVEEWDSPIYIESEEYLREKQEMRELVLKVWDETFPGAKEQSI